MNIISELNKRNIVGRTMIFNRNEFVKTEGTIDLNIYLIEEGSVILYVLDEDEERIIRFGYDGNIVVALDSFLQEKPSNLIIRTIKKTVLRAIPKKNFIEFIQSDKAYLKSWIEILEDLIVQQLEREKDLLTSASKERYLRVMKRSPQLFQFIPHKHIANYLRMSPETLSRLKKP